MFYYNSCSSRILLTREYKSNLPISTICLSVLLSIVTTLWAPPPALTTLIMCTDGGLYNHLLHGQTNKLCLYNRMPKINTSSTHKHICFLQHLFWPNIALALSYYQRSWLTSRVIDVQSCTKSCASEVSSWIVHRVTLSGEVSQERGREGGRERGRRGRERGIVSTYQI